MLGNLVAVILASLILALLVLLYRYTSLRLVRWFMGLGVLMPILIIALRHLTKDEYPDPSLAVYLWPPSFLMVFGGWFTLLLSMILNTLLYALIGYLAALAAS